ncbi:formyl peptide receptor-related sequence 6-like [Aplysia californica]|uniref:Formyl peptide receptor-related sequence 6-like n=1 Tax=Aplysia californica TaxID=6500 RepID=A0ABM1AD64_APLCA|nr:formyl peptide receptor-related sequence 6-like [Aplysia californica]
MSHTSLPSRMSISHLWGNNTTNSRDQYIMYMSLPMTTPSPSGSYHENIVSDEQFHIIKVVNVVVISGVLSLFGVASNIINIVVFAKQGFQDSMNISLMGLAVSDLFSLLTTTLQSICVNPLFYNSELPFDPRDILYLTASVPHYLFVKIATFITAFIAFERCLCIAVPLKVKTIITRGRTKTIIIFIYISMSLLIIPFCLGNRLEWVFDFNKNATVLKTTFTAEREMLEAITFLTQGVFATTFSFVFVLCCTIVLIVKLNSKTKWRQATAAKSDRAAGGVGVKDQKVVKMVTLIAVIFIACSLPSTLLFLYMVIDTDFRIDGFYINLYHVLWSLAFLTETTNSSVNIFVYLKMSSKYRAVFMKIFLNKQEK